MAATSKIEWTDHTWTPIVGCDPVSPACANCYAATMAARLEAMGQEKYRGVAVRVGGKGKWTGKVNFWQPELAKPLTVRKASRWFLTSMGDVAHDAVTDEQIAELFGVMAVAGAAGPFHREADGYTVNGSWYHHGTKEQVPVKWPNMLSGPHTFMVLTKRPQRLARLLVSSSFRRLAAGAAYRWAHNRTNAGSLSAGIWPMPDQCKDGTEHWPLPNAFIGCTVEDQQRANELRPHMAGISAAGWKTFVSYEPALGSVDWTGWEFLAQLISGGESGHKARPSNPDWHRAARDFATCNGIAYLFKQWGAWAPGSTFPDHIPSGESCSFDQELDEDARVWKVGKKAAGRLLDGRTWDQFPEARHGAA